MTRGVCRDMRKARRLRPREDNVEPKATAENSKEDYRTSQVLQRAKLRIIRGDKKLFQYYIMKYSLEQSSVKSLHSKTREPESPAA